MPAAGFTVVIDAWRLSVGTLTALPVQAPGSVDRRRAGMAMVLAPMAVLPLGVAVALVGVAGHVLDLPVLLTALLALGVSALGTRGLHLDGLSDVADALAASYDRERALAVMKSGAAGPAGVVTVVLMLGIQATALSAVLTGARADGSWWGGAILAGVALCASRAALVACCARGIPPARRDGLGHDIAQSVPVILGALVWLVVALALTGFTVWASLAWWRGPVAAAAALLVVLVILTRAVRRFGGVTGDVFGACVEAAFATLLVALS